VAVAKISACSVAVAAIAALHSAVHTSITRPVTNTNVSTISIYFRTNIYVIFRIIAKICDIFIEA
jgi:hypothetical protein